MDACCINYKGKITIQINNTLQFAHVSKKLNISSTKLTWNRQLIISFFTLKIIIDVYYINYMDNSESFFSLWNYNGRLLHQLLVKNKHWIPIHINGQNTHTTINNTTHTHNTNDKKTKLPPQPLQTKANSLSPKKQRKFTKHT